ncbi:transporter substrate-binding domain-containing protein [Planococcus sp. CP5-4]|uniref:transporter substrate-binding domain-containing protein n=1 Tax=unclassified Planococcus (in: firmicutes) TaxID=2662419 RepID=UPI001C24FE6B|nr:MULTISPECIES: transporter substrate-binding domain-containing protein [unclassified Planococcus (in: firmicutes)]MBU9672443.1 transporter substrate-binding domain-containing protein [Planococcus sp. CP5-4_YE]MBV0909494.1 transporter substrate-binding domain-containing protein [Planococcus sp. CP5-4_UN]MBW6064223.1 transporter substrate-binding domain-containing protein [Planococcus sp. CP5-4]
MKKWTLLALLLAVLTVLAACGDSDEESGGGDGETYRVGIDTTYPPFEFEDEGEYTGIDIDLINAIAENQGFEIEFNPMDFGGIIPALQADQLDVAIAGMSITDERKEIVDFSDPYFDAGLSLVVAEDNSDITSLEDLEGKTVAVKSGTTGAQFARDNEDEYGYEISQFEDSPSMFQEVSNGNADVLLEDYPVIAYAIAESELALKTVGERLTGDQYGIAVLKGENAELLEQINAGLQELRDSGEYDEILNKYIAE